MSSVLDFGPIYTQTGNVIQIDYATKCAESGSTIVALKSKKGLVVAIEKPRESKLVPNFLNKRLKKVVNGIYMAYTGLLSDGITILDCVKYDVYEILEILQEKVSPNYLKAIVSRNISAFTRYFAYRPLGCHVICAMHHNGEYKLSLSTCTSKTSFFKACAIGKGSTRAKTELEKLDVDDMDVREMEDHAVRIMYKSYDPLKDKEFDIELCHMSEETFFLMQEVSYEDLCVLVEKYKNYTVDGE